MPFAKKLPTAVAWPREAPYSSKGDLTQIQYIPGNRVIYARNRVGRLYLFPFLRKVQRWHSRSRRNVGLSVSPLAPKGGI